MLQDIGNPFVTSMDSGGAGGGPAAPAPVSTYAGPLSPNYRYNSAPPLSTQVLFDPIAASIVGGLPIDVNTLPRANYVEYPGTVSKPVSDQIVKAIQSGRLDPSRLYSSAAAPVAQSGPSLFNNKTLLIVGVAIAALLASGVLGAKKARRKRK